MATRLTLIVWLGMAVLALTNCSAPGVNNPTVVETPEHHVMAVVEYGGGVDYSDPLIIEKYSQGRVLVVQAPLMWLDDTYVGAIAAMKAANPNLKVVGYVNAHTTWLSWGDPARTDPAVEPFKAEWDAAVRPFWSYTTTGDTMTPWPGKIVVNILEPDCREAMVQVLANHWTSHGNVLDGIFWDHFNEYMWVMNNVPGREGDLDLDGDGIAHRDDEDEMQAYRDASVELIQRTNEVLGSHVIQITNGNRAGRDSVFARLVDGTMHETFPSGFTTMREALELSQPNNLFAVNKWFRTRNGGPFLILSNTGVVQYQIDGEVEPLRKAEFNRIVALLTGSLVAYHPLDQSTHYSWPETAIDLGSPVGAAHFSGDLISREFENGWVRLDFTNGTDYLPFGFEIEQNGQVIQEMQIPFALP